MMNMQGLFRLATQLMQNPNNILQSLNVPSEYSNDPNGAIQYMMNNRMITQEQYNAANAKLKELKNDPRFRNYFKS